MLWLPVATSQIELNHPVPGREAETEGAEIRLGWPEAGSASFVIPVETGTQGNASGAREVGRA